MSIPEVRAKCKEYLLGVLQKHKLLSSSSTLITKNVKVKVQLKTELQEELLLHQKALKLQAETKEPYEEIYVHLVMELCSMIEAGITSPLNYIINDELGWKSPLFYEHADKERRDIINITKPVEVQEGFYTCPACKSKKTHHYNRQMRSADEPMTTFVTCANPDCQYKWRIN